MQRMNLRPHALLACLLLAASSVHAQDAPAPASLRWISSTQSAPWKQMPVEPAPSSAQTSAARISTARTSAATAIQLDSRTAYQAIDGFGSCFNDLGWQALQALDPPTREAALRVPLLSLRRQLHPRPRAHRRQRLRHRLVLLRRDPRRLRAHPLLHRPRPPDAPSLHPRRHARSTQARHLGRPLVAAHMDEDQRGLQGRRDEGRSANPGQLRALFFEVHPGLSRRGHTPLRRHAAERAALQQQRLPAGRLVRRAHQHLPARLPHPASPAGQNLHPSLAG